MTTSSEEGLLIDDHNGIAWITPFLYGSDLYGLPIGNI